MIYGYGTLICPLSSRRALACIYEYAHIVVVVAVVASIAAAVGYCRLEPLSAHTVSAVRARYKTITVTLTIACLFALFGIPFPLALLTSVVVCSLASGDGSMPPYAVRGTPISLHLCFFIFEYAYVCVCGSRCGYMLDTNHTRTIYGNTYSYSMQNYTYRSMPVLWKRQPHERIIREPQQRTEKSMPSLFVKDMHYVMECDDVVCYII